MGTGASSRSISPVLSVHNQHTNKLSVSSRKESLGFGLTKWKGQNVISNEVAPILITKGCFEEYQCTMLVEKQIITKGRISKGLPEHALLQHKYFMVADCCKQVDKLNTRQSTGVPNFRKCEGDYPVYGMGQPTRNGLSRLMDDLQSEGCPELLVVCIREEPVIFLQKGCDLYSYSPRTLKNLDENISTERMCGDEITDMEVAIRKEITNHALRDEHNQFYFYEDIVNFQDEPHCYDIMHEEDMYTCQEIFSIYAMMAANGHYLRMPLQAEGAPEEKVIDQFLLTLKEIPSLFDHENTSLPTLAFIGYSGIARTTFAMVLGVLVLAHKKGFPEEAYQWLQAVNDENPNLERGEFAAVLKLCRMVPNGFQMKQEVDVLIDKCNAMGDIHSQINEFKCKLESSKEDYDIMREGVFTEFCLHPLPQGHSSKEYFLKRAHKHLERYCYLIIINSYLHQQFSKMFSQPFSTWMQQRPELYRLLGEIDKCELYASPQLVTDEIRYLVVDDYFGLDVLSSQRDVKVSNFRRVPGLPVYGMAQPSAEGLAKVIKLLTNAKHNHSSVHLFNLRSELIVESNNCTYTVRELSNLRENIILPGIDRAALEKMEREMKEELLKIKKPLQVYQDVTDELRQLMEFDNVHTLQEIAADQMKQDNRFHYYRLPVPDDQTGLGETVIDEILSLVKDLDDIYTDEDGPALVFNCQSGKGRTTCAMAIAGLIMWHKKGFPVGVKLGEQERISVPYAEYTKGEFAVVMQLVRRLPWGTQVKREVDLMLDKCSETMTPMHHHLREVIFSMYNKIKVAKTDEEVQNLRQLSLVYLERYIYLIVFNCYLHLERCHHWEKSFSLWMKDTGRKVGVYEILNSLHFHDLDEDSNKHPVSTMRDRWCRQTRQHYFRGVFM